MKKSNNYSKFVATAATATLVATAVVPAASAQEMKFTDVGDRYVDAVNYLVENNITQGLTETKFGTQSNIKRVDVAVLIAKATLTEDEINNAPASTFGDVPARATKYVSALKAKGIINGKTATSFGSDLSITRGEAAIMLSKAYEIEGDTANVKFGDVGTRYKDAVAALVDNEITTGKTDSSFGTDLSITRGELAIFLQKLETLHATPAPENKVESVEAISGTQVQVKFTDAVNPASLFKDGKMGEFKKDVFTMSPVGSSEAAGTVSGMISKDGKTLTITTTNVVKGDYTVVINQLISKEDKAIEKFSKVVTIAADTTAPKVLTTEKVNSTQYVVKFSEPMQTLGTITYKDENGKTIEALENSFEKGDSQVLFTLPADLAAGKSITAQVVAAKDMSGNLVAPNPTDITFTKGQPDGVAPTVKSIEQLDANKFTVTFSEELVGNPTVTVGGVSTTVEKDATNPLQYVVTASGNLTTAQTVVVKDFTDLSGENGASYSKVVTFTEDAEAPVVTATNIVADSENLQQYVEFTFNKDVNLDEAKVSATGKYVKNYVTTSGLTLPATAVDYKEAGNKKVVRVAMKDLVKGNDVEGAAYELLYTLSGVKTLSNVELKEKTGQLKFTRVADGTKENTKVVAVKTAEKDAEDNNKVIVTFDQAVEGATATNKENYTINGATIENVTLLPVAKNKTQQAVLNLTPGSSTFNGERAMTITNIKALGSTKTMESWNSTITLNENVAPTVTTAILTGTKEITLTFSEAVTSGDEFDFEILVDGKSMTTALNVNAAVKEGTKEAVITLGKKDAAFTTDQINKGITLKPVDTMDIKDVNGNMLSVPANITVTK
ncbi:S-layer homology domain-containing protein [Sporosarcina sp. BI001-red]|uniref:S-layer homology domain-containing protein n=1 Tax=Sporosarcina sp. BI001-red TaxID=2282866 RepID=UPI000E26F815|nr:S-layer homology domain-containing protein [Sporosarcina sp. BI001-red]REB08714.1 S-layer homology domain-containing protein [Sporosarcina sp. BI001-red]